MGIKKNFFAPWALELGATRRAAMLLLVMLLTTAMAWAQSGTCGDVTWSLTGESPDYTLTISGTGDMPDYDDPEERPWHDNAADISNVVIENGVTTIGNYAFYDCQALTSVTIPASVTSIGDDAFESCINLTTVTIPASVTSIGNYAFSECHILGSVTFAEGSQLKSIGAYAFSGTGLTSIEIPAGVKSIGEAAFTGSGLTSIEIPASVTSIGEDAFSSCTNLGSVTFADGSQLESIGDLAFAGSDLTSITIPASVTSIGSYVFQNCDLASITVADGNTVYDSRNGCNAIIEKSTNTLIIGCNNSTIPAGVTSIGNYAFYTTRLTSIEIPASVTSIGMCAFLNCTSLATVTVYAPSCTLGVNAFANCNKLANIYVLSEFVDDYQGAENWSDYKDIIAAIPNPHGYCGTTGHEKDVIWVLTGESPNYTLTISGTGDMADYSNPEERPWHDNAEKITNVVIEEGVTSIGDDAFDGCGVLTSIEIPASVTSIGNYAFYDTYLTSIEIPANVTSIGEGVFGRCSYLETMTVDSGNTVYDSRNNSNAIIKKSDNTLIAGCKETEIPDDVTSIGILAFYNCQSLTSVTIPASVTSIGEGAFEGSGLESITISANVTSIGNHAFEGCRNLGTMTVDGENTVYDSRNNCNAIIKTSTHTLIAGCKNTIIPNDVTSIGVSAFDGCENLTSVTIPANVTSIGDDAFMYCESLTSVTVYAPSCSLGTSAFYGCNNLTDIYVFGKDVVFYKGATNWTAYADKISVIFDGTSTETINIPNEVTVKGVTYNRTFTPGKASTVMLPFDYTCNGQEGGTFYKFVGVEKENDNWVATMKATGDDANNQGTLTRNTPYLFMPTATTMTFPNINGSVTLSTDGGGNCETADEGSHWTFKGTYEYMKWTTETGDPDYNAERAAEIGYVYGFAGVAKTGINVGDFVRVASGAKIRPMGCYLLWNNETNSANARSFTRGAAATEEELPQRITVRLVGSNDETTAIGTIDNGQLTIDNYADADGWYDLQGRKLSGKPTKKGLYINNGRKIVIK